MNEPFARDDLQPRAGARAQGRAERGRWTRRLVLFLRIMAGVSMLKGLYHWALVCGIGVDANDVFEYHSIAWQAATIFFAVIDLIAAVGLWLAAAWGGVVWLTAVISMAGGRAIFPAGVWRSAAGGHRWKADCSCFI